MKTSKIVIGMAILILGIIFLFAEYSSAQEDPDVKVVSKYGAKGDPGNPVQHRYEVINIGEPRQRYVLKISCEHNWDISFIESNDYGLIGEEIVTEQLDSAEAITVDIRVIIPYFNMDTYLNDGTWAWEDATLQLKASCYDNRYIEDTNITQTMVNLIHTVQVKAIPESLEVESVSESDEIERRTAHYKINVTHVCNDDDIENATPLDIVVSMGEPQGNWIPSSNKLNKTEDTLKLNLKVRESCFVTLDVIAGVNESVGECLIVVYGNLSEEPSKYDTAFTYTTVQHKPDVEIIDVTPDAQDGKPEEKLVYSFKIQNTGNGVDSYFLIVSSENGWKINASNRIDGLGANEIEIVDVTIRIPAREPIGTKDTLTLKAISVASQSSIFDNKSAITTVIQGYSVDLEPEKISGTVKPDSSVTYEINVTNTGNGEDTISFEIQKYVYLNWTTNVTLGSTDWGVTTPSSITLKTGKMQKVKITVNAPKDIQAYTNVTVFLTGRPTHNGKSDTTNITTMVERVNAVEVEAINKTGKGKPYDILVFNFTITNLGNVEDYFKMEAKTENNWTTHVFLNDEETSIINISRHGEKSGNQYVDYKKVKVEVEVSHNFLEQNALDGAEEVLTLTATSQTDNKATGSDTATITVEQFFDVLLRTASREDKSEQTGHKLILGGKTKYYVEVQNIGNGNDTFDISVSVLGNNWEAFIENENNEVKLQAKKSTFIEVFVEAPNTAQWGSKSPPIFVKATSLNDTEDPPVNHTVEIPTSTISYFDFTKTDNFHYVNHDVGDVCTVTGFVYTNNIIYYELDVCNAYHKNQNFTISFPKGEQGWNISISENNFRLGDYARKTINIIVKAPDIINASRLFQRKSLPEEEINIVIKSGSGHQNSITIIIKLLRLDLRVTNIELDGKFIEGELIKINATIGAYGASVEHDILNNVTNILVKFYVEDKEIYAVTIPYLLKGESTNIIFNWTISSLDWKEKRKNIEIKIMIVEYNSIAGNDTDFETSNNSASQKITVEDNPLIGTNNTLSSIITFVIILMLILIILSLDLSLRKRKAFKLVGLSLFAFFVSFLLALIFTLPWNDYLGSSSNFIGNIIIYLSFYLIFPVMTLLFSIRARSYFVSMFTAIVPFIVFCIIVTIGGDFSQFSEALADLVTIGAIVLCISIGIISSYFTYKAYYFAGQRISNITEMCRSIRGEIYGAKTER